MDIVKEKVLEIVNTNGREIIFTDKTPIQITENAAKQELNQNSFNMLMATKSIVCNGFLFKIE